MSPSHAAHQRRNWSSPRLLHIARPAQAYSEISPWFGQVVFGRRIVSTRFSEASGDHTPHLRHELTRSSYAAGSEIKMKVFISWSGDRSHEIAKALSDWLPRVIQSIEPWISSRDIDAGARWGEELKEQLLVGRAGSLCLVPDNLDAVWIHYEAGALSKTVEKAMVIPYLSGVSITDLDQPLSAFYACEAAKEGTLKMLKALNKGTKPLAESILHDAFEKQWSTLNARLAEISEGSGQVPVKTERELLEHLISLARSSQDAIDNLRAEVAKTSPSGGRTGALLGSAVPAVSGTSITGTAGAEVLAQSADSILD